MATKTLLQLRTAIRQVANVENNQFVTDPELNDRINEAIAELYDLILSVYEGYYCKFTDNFTLAGGQTGNSIVVTSLTLSSIPISFYKDNTLEWNPGSSNMRIVKRLPSDLERDSASGRSYEIVGTPPVLIVYPPEESAGVYRLKFTPDAPVLVADGDSLDATMNKWYEFILYRVAIAIHLKRQKVEDASILAGNVENPNPGTLAYVRQNLLSLARNRQAQPQQVPLGRRRSSFWDWDDRS